MPGSRVLIIVDHFLIIAPSKALLTSKNNFPWTLSNEMCSAALVSCSDCSASIAKDLVGSRSNVTKTETRVRWELKKFGSARTIWKLDS